MVAVVTALMGLGARASAEDGRADAQSPYPSDASTDVAAADTVSPCGPGAASEAAEAPDAGPLSDVVPLSDGPAATPSETSDSGPRADESGSLFKDALGVAVSARAAFFSKDLSFSGNSGFAVGSLWLTAKPEKVFGIKTYVDARMQDQDMTRGSRLALELREGYAEGSIDNLDVKVGRQITVWGRADKVNPTDVWSTRDLTLLAPNDEDQFLGVFALQAAWNQWGFRLIGIWQPEWRIPEFPIPPLPAGVSIQNLEPSERAAQWGVRLDHSGGIVDYAISYAHAINRTPDLSVLSARPEGVQVGLKYNPVDVIGADAAIVFGDFGIRAEVAYTNTENDDGENLLMQNNNIFTVIGADRTVYGVLNFNVQYLYRHTFNWRDPERVSEPSTKLLAQQEALISNQLARDMQGGSFRIDYKAFHETLEGEMAAVAWFNRGDGALRPKIAYAFTDHIQGLVGAQVYLGPANSFFGRFDSASTVFSELRLNL